MKFNTVLKKTHRHTSMRWRLFFAMIVFTFVVLLLWVGIQRFLLTDIYKAVKMSSVNQALSEITQILSSPDMSQAELEEIVNDSAIKYDTCISVWDKELKQTASRCVNKGCRVHSYSLVGAAYYYRKAKSNGGAYVQSYGLSTPTANEDDVGKPPFTEDDYTEGDDGVYTSIIYAKITHDKNGDECLVLLNTIITPLISVKKSLSAIFMTVGVIMVLLSLIISIALSSYVIEPITKIGEGAKLLAKGNYNVRFDEDSYSEIAQLAQTLNYAASELSGVERVRRELMANVSHDLRTPLTLISGYAEMMKDFPNDDNRDSLQVIIDEANHMILLVNDMADVSKYNAGVQKLQLAEIDFTAKIADTAARIKTLNYDEYDIVFEPEENVVLTGDELKLTQVLYNLINNAITHTGEDKKVIINQKVEEESHRKYVRIEVTDSGDGISAEDAQTIWNRYYKMDKTYKRAHNGSGLGLNIVKSILELHHAEYGVISRDKMPNACGCTFWFRIQIEKTVKITEGKD